MMKLKLKDWIWRYFPAEIVGTITALTSAIIANSFTHSALVSSFAGTWGEFVGYYGFFLFQELRTSMSQYKKENTRYGITSCFINIRNLVLEFGIPEWLDSSLIRPFCMYFFPKALDNFVLGIMAGKITADIVFYIGVIIAYEIKKKHLKG